MHREFGIIGVYTDLVKRTVQVDFTLDIDPDSATLDSFVLCDKETGKIVPANIAVNKKTVMMHLQDWPVAKKEYLLRIQSGIRTIVDDELPDSLQRVVVFKSEVLSTVNIASPSQHEVLHELHVRWKEVGAAGKEESLVSSFYLEIAKENAFYNIVRATEVVDREDVLLADVEPGQYYMRIRAQKNGEYGRWSEVVTFIVKEKQEITTPEEHVIFEEELEVIESPQNGESLDSFVFVFNEEIDTDNLPTIIVKRRSI